MRNEYHNSADERSIKHLKETIETLKRDIIKLKTENKIINLLKDSIKKLQEEKFEMSQKIIDLESESLLFKSGKDNKEDILLYTPRLSSIKQFHKLLSQSHFSFSFRGKKNSTILSKSQNEEIIVLKNELVKKEEIISLLKGKNSQNELKKEKCNNFIINVVGARNNSAISRGKVSPLNYSRTIKDNTDNSIKKYNEENISKYINSFSCGSSSSSEKKRKNNPLKNEILTEETERINLERNINKEIENILEEKKNFILNTLAHENFSFDILRNKKQNSYQRINGLEDIDRLICIIKKRKEKVKKNKKYLEEIIG